MASNRMEGAIRLCREDERETMERIINDAAQAYRGVIPADRWHEPYMPAEKLGEEIAVGVTFWGCEQEGELLGVMGIQDRGEVTLIRHAYVLTSRQGQGIGGRLLRHLQALTDKPILIGTWASAEWAVRFYQHYGYRLVDPETKARLLHRYWSIPERQVETSVVLGNSVWWERKA